MWRGRRAAEASAEAFFFGFFAFAVTRAGVLDDPIAGSRGRQGRQGRGQLQPSQSSSLHKTPRKAFHLTGEGESNIRQQGARVARVA
jgi:hypothetical protein